MRNRKSDIEKYLRGELSAAEMHALEKRALTDPFLADALEGAGTIDTDMLSTDLATLRKRMGDRDSAKVRPLWLWPARIAAGIALLGLASYFVLTLTRKEPEQHIAQNQAAPKMTEENIPATRQESDSISSTAGSGSAITEKPTPELPVAAGKSRSAAGNEEKEEPIAVAKAPVVDSDTLLAAVSGDAQPREVLREAPAAQAGPEAGYTDAMRKLELSVHPKKKKVITGTVVDAEDGRALPGVNVMIEGTPVGTTTNEEGKYVIATDSLDAGLLFSFIGYENKVVTDPAGNLDVMLDPDIAELSEVVVVGYGGVKRDDPEGDPIIELAEPAGGRRAYKQYLAENFRYPEQALNNKIEGRVTVQFSIDPAGKMSDFKVLRGQGYGCDEEVIRLIRQGPKWRPSRKNTEPVADKVKVRMKFRLPKK